MKCVLYFTLEDVPDDQKTKLMLLSLEGKAFAWQQQYLKIEGNMDIPWKKVMEDLACHFDLSIYMTILYLS